MEQNKKRKLHLGRILSFIVIIALIAFLIGSFIKNNEKLDNNGTPKELTPEEKLKQQQNAHATCMREVIKEEDLKEEIKNEIETLKNLFTSNSHLNFAFAYLDINTGFTISYNADTEIYAASVTKTAPALYIYDMASVGRINLDKKRVNEPRFSNSGSGILKNRAPGGEYTLRYLTELMITISDNIATRILQDEVTHEAVRAYFEQFGVTSLYTPAGLNFSSLCGNITANDGNRIMLAIYNFYQENKTGLGGELWNYFLDSDYKMIGPGVEGYKVASKYGWAINAIHDTAIVYSDNPYALTVLTNRGRVGGGQTFIRDVSTKVNRIHNLYHEQKTQSCAFHLD